MTEQAMKFTCHKCGKEGAPARTKGDAAWLPRGWRRLDENTVECDQCFSAAHRIIAVTIPIVGPVEGTWDDLGDALRQCWEWSTRLHTWAMARLHLSDPGIDPDTGKGPMPPVNLYAEATRDPRFEGMPRGSMAAVLQVAIKKYRAARWNIFIGGKGGKGRSDWPKFRYPTPFPIRAQGNEWNVRREDQSYVVSCSLGGRRWSLILRGGKEFARQLRAVDGLLAGQNRKCELAIYSVPANKGDNRSGLSERENGGGERKRRRVMAKLVMYVPRQESSRREGTLIVRTLPSSFLVARTKGSKANGWWVHGDHVQQRIALHRRRLRRWADDSKSEVRGRRGGLNAKRERASRKQRDFMGTFCKQSAASLARYAHRQRVSSIVYDDTERGWAESFPYAQFWTDVSNSLAKYTPTISVISRAALKNQKELAELQMILGDMLSKENKRNVNGSDGDDE